MTGLSIVSTALLFIAIMYIWVHLSHRRYNADEVLPDKGKLVDQVAVMSFSYRMMHEIVTALLDLDYEMERSVFFRFWKYPYSMKRKILFVEIVQLMSERMALLEASQQQMEGTDG
jgi:hypothetical protein